VGDAARANIAITEINAGPSHLASGLPLPMTADIRATGLVRPIQAEIEWLVDDRSVERTKLDPIGDATSRRVQALLPPMPAGAHTITARLRFDGDALSDDDQRVVAIETPHDQPILIVESRSTGRAAEQAGFYLSAALSPRATSRPNQPRGAFAPLRAADYELATQVLADQRVVILADVPRLSADIWMRLARYVREGGALVIWPGRRADLDHYNAMIGPSAADAESRGLMPAALTPPAGGDVRPTTLRIADPNHAIVTDFSGHASGGLLSTPIDRHIGLVGALAGGARTILDFADGAPALIDHPYGRGRVYVWTTSPDMAWHTLPARPDFVPLVMNLIAQAAAETTDRRNVSVGDAMTVALDRTQMLTTPTVRGPDGSAQPSRLVESRAEPGAPVRYAAEFDGTDEPGAYALETPNRTWRAAAVIDADECDLSRADDELIHRALGPDVAIVDWNSQSAAPSIDAPARDLSGGLLIALFLVLLGESMLAALFGNRK
jgi:hypothetical protein